MRDAFMISATDLLGDLTWNQARAMLFALDSGYYSVPKKITTEVVAARMGVPRTTFEEHLRKAESKVLRSVAPYMKYTIRKGSRQETTQSRNRPKVEHAGFEPSEFAVPPLTMNLD